MSLPVTEVERELLHTRRVRYEGYKRADGLWDIEAHLTDIKNHDYRLKTGVRRAGQPGHTMWLRPTLCREEAKKRPGAWGTRGPPPPKKKTPPSRGKPGGPGGGGGPPPRL